MSDRVHELAEIWRKMISTDHHKHKDGYFFISKSWSYDHSAKYHAKHDAYIGEDLFGPYRDSYAEAEADLIAHIIKQIKEQERWALGVMSRKEDDRWSEREAEWILKVISENAELIKGETNE